MRPISRVMAFFSKWVAEVIRQPALMLTLIVGPFLVLLAFGEGVEIGGPRPRTIIVEPQGPRDPLQPLPEEFATYIDLVETTENLPYARDQLRRGQVDAVIVIPEAPTSYIESGQHVPIQVFSAEIDPVRMSYARSYLSEQVTELNRITIARSIETAQAEGGDTEALTGLEIAAGVRDLPPEVLSSPFELQLENVSPFVPTFAGFYAPAVLALLLQHLAVTLGALSMTRIRLLRLTDLMRVAPVRPSEVVLGNYLSYALLCAVAAAGLLALMIVVLDVPVFGSWALLVGMIALLIIVGLGFGFVISILSSSEQQATQLAMLILLASIFFSGFAFDLSRIQWPVRAISYTLPSTYAIGTFQDVMLRGVFREQIDFIVMGVAAVAFLLLTIMLLRREFRPG